MTRHARRKLRRMMFILALSAACTVIAVLYWGLKGPPSQNRSATTQAAKEQPVEKRSNVNHQAPVCETEEDLAAFSRPAREEVQEAVRQIWILIAIGASAIALLLILWAILHESPTTTFARKAKTKKQGSGPVLPPRERKTERIELDPEGNELSSE